MTTVIHPKYLLTDSVDKNDAYMGYENKIEFLPGPGYLERHPSCVLKEDKTLSFRNQPLTFPGEDFTDTWTLQFALKNQTTTAFSFQTDPEDDTLLPFRVVVTGAWVYGYYGQWTVLQREIPEKIREKDDYGYMYVTIIKREKTLDINVNGYLAGRINSATYKLSNNCIFMQGNFDTEYVSFTPKVTLAKSLWLSKDDIKRYRTRQQKLIDLEHDVYSSEIYENTIISEVISESNWIYGKTNKGYTKCFFRPRGLDKGIDIASVVIDHKTDEWVFTLDDPDATEHRVAMVLEDPPEGLQLPPGTGVNVGDKHIPLVSTDFDFKKYNLDQSITLPDGQKTLSYIRDRSVQNLSDASSPKLFLNEFNYGTSGSVITVTNSNVWQAPKYEASSTDLNVFEVLHEGDGTQVIKVKPGKYELDAHIRRLGHNGEHYGIRLKVASFVVLEKVFDTRTTNAKIRESLSVDLLYEFEVLEEGILIIEEHVNVIANSFVKNAAYSRPEHLNRLVIRKL